MNTNPLIENIDTMSEQELQDTISDLTKKYFMASSNPQVQGLLLENLEIFKSELTVRQAQNREKNNSDDNGLDNLINID